MIFSGENGGGGGLFANLILFSQFVVVLDFVEVGKASADSKNIMIEQILNECVAEGNNVKLPQTQVGRDVYLEVAAKLKKIGGKWVGGKVQAFVFDHDPTELLTEIQNGADRNIKKEFQLFETPLELADKLVFLSNPQEPHIILEPSAGRGAIIHAIHRKLQNKNVNWYEIMPENQTILFRVPNATLVAENFLECNSPAVYDRIIANPPFSKNQDIDHIRKMYAVLADGGRIVSVASKHWQISSNRKETEFRNWLDKVGAEIHEIEAGAFKESGTNISAVIIVIDKN